MGIVIKQSFRNAFITYVGFGIGAINALFLYTYFLGKTYYGVTAFVLSSASLLMPLMAFGSHNLIIKYFPYQGTEKQKSGYLTAMLLLPWLWLLPFSAFLIFFYGDWALLLSRQNQVLLDFIWVVPVVGLCMSYFEIFYAWLKVHFQSVFGNFVKEVWIRLCVSAALVLVYFKYITPVFFVFSLIFIYALATLVVMILAFWVRKPIPGFYLPTRFRTLLGYAVFIILAGSVAALMLDLDRFMISQFIPIEQVAFYSVAVFITAVIAVPNRAMHQITHPLTAKLMASGQQDELQSLYRKSAINLQWISGLIYIGILVNLNNLYQMIPAEYAGGSSVVFLIGLSKYFESCLGNNNAIIFNSDYYKIVLSISFFIIALAAGLNYSLIPLLGISGAAVATLISLSAYSLLKLYFVTTKLNLSPFTVKNLYLGLLGALTFGIFYFWEFPFHPIINIFLKSALTAGFYVVVTFKWQLTGEWASLIGQRLSAWRDKLH